MIVDKSASDLIVKRRSIHSMKRSIPLLAILTAVASGGCMTSEMPGTADNEIEYRGETIKLRKSYSNYDEYKYDPNNIDPAELPRVEKLVSSAPIAGSFADRQQMIHAIVQLPFPGYGFWQFGDKAQADGSVLAGYGIEISGGKKARILAFQSRGTSFDLIDDSVGPFDASIEDRIASVTVTDGRLVYSTQAKATALIRDLAEAPR